MSSHSPILGRRPHCLPRRQRAARHHTLRLRLAVLEGAGAIGPDDRRCASLVGPLAEAGVSVFVVSTFDTDYLLVKGEALPKATEALGRAGHAVKG